MGITALGTPGAGKRPVTATPARPPPDERRAPAPPRVPPRGDEEVEVAVGPRAAEDGRTVRVHPEHPGPEPPVHQARDTLGLFGRHAFHGPPPAEPPPVFPGPFRRSARPQTGHRIETARRLPPPDRRHRTFHIPEAP